MNLKCFHQNFVVLLVLLVISSISSHAATIINSIPGYPGNLPFHLETGYIGVGEEEQVQLFYYFIESERDPERDPLLLWLTGGPGCSALSGLVLEIGPLNFNYTAASWQLEVPKFELNPYSWTKVASVIFLDSPVGTGFSYSITSEGYYSDDITASRHNHEFMKKWLGEHVKFQNNPIYISGDSYAGKIVPVIVKEILRGNKYGLEPSINLKGYILGNPFTVPDDVTNSRYQFAHRVSLLSDELYESATMNCNGHFDDVDVGDTECKKDFQAILYNVNPLFRAHVLEPKCNVSASHTPCREDKYWLFFLWANNIRVQQALGIREGTKIHWARCNKTLAYEKSLKSSFGYHQSSTKELIHALIYSGDQDMDVSYVGTLQWIMKLNISIVNNWRPWFVKGQVAGYTMKYSNGHYHLTFATVKGAGHTAPEYKPQECLHMVENWLRKNPL